MAGNLDATYPTKTEFKDVPVDPSAASKSSLQSYVARSKAVPVEDKVFLTTILPTELLSPFPVAYTSHRHSCERWHRFLSGATIKVANLRVAAQGRLGTLVATTTLQQRPRTRRSPPRPHTSLPGRLGMTGNSQKLADLLAATSVNLCTSLQPFECIAEGLRRRVGMTKRSAVS